MGATSAVIEQDTEQDKPRNDERGTQVEQRRVAWLCADYGFGPSKASRIVRRFDRDCARHGWTPEDVTFIDFLVTEAIVAKGRCAEALDRLLHSDPTGQAAARNADAADAGRRVKAAWAAEYGHFQYQQAASVAGLARHQVVKEWAS